MNEQALEYARETGYLTTDGKSPDLQRAWMREMHEMGMPYVEIVLNDVRAAARGAGAKLVFEVGYLDPRVATAAKTLFRRYLEHHRVPRAHYKTVSNGAIGPLPIADAKRLAADILAIVAPERAV